MEFSYIGLYQSTRIQVTAEVGGICSSVLKTIVEKIEGCPRDYFYVTVNGRLLESKTAINGGCVVRGIPRLVGGKGGFGSMLRALGARIEKTTNREACRDLSGRRMRDINNEKKISEWLQKQEEKDQEKQDRRQAKLERILNPKHAYADVNYTATIQDNAEKIEDAISFALSKKKARGPGVKRKTGDGPIVSKKPRMWMGVGDVSDASSEGGEVDETNADEHVRPTDSSTPTGEDIYKNADVAETHSDANGLIPSVMSDDKKALTEPGRVSDTPPLEGVGSELPEAPEIRAEFESGALNLSAFKSAAHLESLGLDRLKSALMALGMKCGGTLQERAQRLFLARDTPLDQLDPSMFAKGAKAQAKKPAN